LGGSGTALTNFYRNNGRVPATRSVNNSVREPASGDAQPTYFYRWYTYRVVGTSWFEWNTVVQGSVGVGATSATVDKFAAEGQYCVTMRDSTWNVCYSILNNVQAGNSVMPSLDEIMTELPVLVWPV